MAKTNFVDGDKSQGIPGTRVLAAFMNKIFSHRHDGLDADGSGPLNYAVASGDGATYTVSLTPALAAHIEGMPLVVKFTTANTTTTPTINPNGLGAVQMQRKNGVALYVGDIAVNHFATLVYNGSSYDVINPYLLRDQSVTASKATALLGAWDVTKAVNTSYLAATDGFVAAYGNSTDSNIVVLTDASNPPTTSRVRSDPAGASTGPSVMCPVRKGDYWKVTSSCSSLYIFWIPLGS